MEALEHDADSKVREAAGYVLAEYRDPRVIDPLIDLLTDADPSVRETAVRALGETAEAVDRTRAVEPLKQALRDSDWGVRQSAAEMLIRLKSDPQHVAEKLLLADLHNDDAEVRLGAAWSLVELGDARSLDPLVRLLYHDDSRISANAAQALGNLGDQRAATPLNATLNHPEEEVRAAVQTALRQLGHTV
jgi:HEAT repeat protein